MSGSGPAHRPAVPPVCWSGVPGPNASLQGRHRPVVHHADPEDEQQRILIAWKRSSFLAEVVRESLGFAVADHFLISVLHHWSVLHAPLFSGGALRSRWSAPEGVEVINSESKKLVLSPAAAVVFAQRTETFTSRVERQRASR